MSHNVFVNDECLLEWSFGKHSEIYTLLECDPGENMGFSGNNGKYTFSLDKITDARNNTNDVVLIELFDKCIAMNLDEYKFYFC